VDSALGPGVANSGSAVRHDSCNRFGWRTATVQRRYDVGLILFLIMGLIAGFIARALVPGSDSMGWVGTMVLGVIGSFIGGTLAALLFGGSLELNAAGIIGSIIGAIIALLIWRRMGGRRGVTV